MAQLRAFTRPEERALVKLHALLGQTQLDITRDRPSIYTRLADNGLAAITTVRRQKRARLTATGRYFAELIAARETRS
ncbi:hypothetical protein [Bosea sp. 685]|uniref:hypothetical protein n=1 Tax=Bosea sp. 685 TaxID=3080057 RepID=UPI0028936E9F|nr:hypothetical protein [Bosea sp. 685]WNJ89143.1 hypothetical protein RMR04_22390 [Bosea sp. 685]